MKTRELYKRLRDAVEARGDDSVAVEGLSVAAARSLIGPEAARATTTLIRNAKRTLAAELRRKEMQTVADWIIASVRTRFGSAEVGIKRNRIIQVYLDGRPEEVEE